MVRLVCGVGINDIKGSAKKVNGKQVHFYTTWNKMLVRCYSEKYQQEYPTYKGCYVCDEWLTLSNFKEWYDKQYYVSKFHLDKDILVPSNKVYSPETCRFVPSDVNHLLKDGQGGNIAGYLIGVRSSTSAGKPYRLSVNSNSTNLCHKKYKQLKIPCTYETEQQAHEVHRYIKSEVIKDVVDQLDIDHPKLDPLISEALLLRAEKLLDFNLKYEDFM